MKVTVTTRNSTYVLDKEAMTWTRTQTSERSGVIRTEEGQISVWPAEIMPGYPLVIHCPKLNPASDGRVLITSRVLSIEEAA